jgi:hypothetical protein
VAAILFGGGVSERPKEHASKACEVQASVGSNPTATANVSGGSSLRDGIPVARRIACRLSCRLNSATSRRPQQAADLRGDAIQDRRGQLLIATQHRRIGPLPHESHHSAFRDAQEQEHCRRGVPSVMQPRITQAR